MFAQDGATITTAPLWDPIDVLATALKTTYDAIWTIIQAEPVLREQQQRADVLPSTGLAKAVNFRLNHEHGLRVFLDDPAVPICNDKAMAP
jgi:hypothetical protein